jgi:hypothetical protein
MRVSLILAMAVVMAMPVAASAQGGQGKRCKPGMTWQMCYERCLQLSGTARTDMMRCSKRCTNRGCQ